MQKDRFVFDNLIYKISEKNYLLTNMVNFRRQVVDFKTITILKELQEKMLARQSYTAEENTLFQQFLENSQIIGQEAMDKINNVLLKEIPPFPEKIRVTRATFNLTHLCNFSCSYCYQHKFNNQEKYRRIMGLAEVNQIKSFLTRANLSFDGFEKIVISGGEALLPSNVDTINYIIDSFPAEEREVFTNGMNILQLKNLVNYNQIHSFQVSLDGDETILKDINKSKGSLNSIIHGIEYLLSEGKKVSVPIMWTRELSNSLPSFIELIRTTGFIDNPHFSFKMIVANNYYSDSIIDTNFYDWMDLVDDRIAFAGNLAKELGVGISLSSEINYLAKVLFRPVNERIRPRIKRCTIQNGLPVVFEPNGEIHWCMCLGEEKGVIGNYKSGELDIERIALLEKHTIFDNRKCQSCPVRYICGGGCILYNIGQNKSSIIDPSCNIFNNDLFWDNLELFVDGER